MWNSYSIVQVNKLEFPRQVLVEIHNKKLNESPSSGQKMFHVNERKDAQTLR
jgi:hypothetical protein